MIVWRALHRSRLYSVSLGPILLLTFGYKNNKRLSLPQLETSEVLAISALQRLRQEYCEFKATLGHIDKTLQERKGKNRERRLEKWLSS